MATAKDKYYKLNEVINLFVDHLTKTKILTKQVVKVEGNGNKSKKLQAARRNGHIVEVEVDEYNDYLADQKGQTVIIGETETEGDKETNPEILAFMKLKNDDMRAKIRDEYDLAEDEDEALDSMKKDELIAKYKELIEED